MIQQRNITSTDPQRKYALSPKWIRGFLGGKCIADSKKCLLVWTSGKPSVYFFPYNDVKMEFLTPETGPDGNEQKKFWTVKAGDSVAEAAAWSYPYPLPK